MRAPQRLRVLPSRVTCPLQCWRSCCTPWLRLPALCPPQVRRHLVPIYLLEHVCTAPAMGTAETLLTQRDMLCAGLRVYDEAQPYYQQMQAHAASLQLLLSGTASDAAALSALTPQAAGAMAAAVTAEQVTASVQVAAAQQALSGSAAAAAAMEAHLHSRASAVLAAAIVQV